MRRLVCLLAAGLAWSSLAPAVAGPEPAGSALATSASAAPEQEEEEAPRIASLRATGDRIAELMAGKLALDVDPDSLVAIPLDDDVAVQIERKRLEAIVASFPSAEGGGGSAHEAGAGGRATEDPVLRARVELDRRRLAFLALPTEDRSRLLDEHRQRRTEVEAKQDAAQQAAQEVQAAEAKRQEALRQAQAARSEAERLVAEELARLLAVEREQAELKQSLAARQQALDAHGEAVLVWRRRVSEALATLGVAQDELYDALRRDLRAARAELDTILTAPAVEAPGPGPDPLVDLTTEIDRTAVDTKRAELLDHANNLGLAARALRDDEAERGVERMEELNRLRLELLPALSADKRDAITGFGSAGRDQAGSEGFQVSLTLRYHVQAATQWLHSLRKTGRPKGESALIGTWLILQGLTLAGLLWWWRKRADRLLTTLRQHVRDSHAKATTTRRAPVALTERPPADRALALLLRIRSPLELLLGVLVAEWLLPRAVQELLEVQLLTTALGWTLGGAVVVQTIDALASEEVLGGPIVSNATESAELRLRSLQLVGRAVVVVGLILAVTSQLVGRGTIHSWVWSTCWFSSIPLFAVLVKWWQPLIYERVELIRKKTWFETWVLDHREGAASFVAASAASIVLFARGVAHVVKTRVLTFDATRRALAYLFRRGLSKKAEDIADVKSEPLEPDLLLALGPETPSTEVVESVADEQREEIIHRIEAPGGGVFAVVGERGGGKTMLLGRIAETSNAIVQVRCGGKGLRGLTSSVNAALDLPEDTPLAEAAEVLAGQSKDSALLIDDAHHLILPMMGGLAEFDQVLDVARSHSGKCTWVFAIDEVIWSFFERARGARPLFDDVIHLRPWSEGAIVRLLTHRTTEHGLSPNFERLVADLPADVSPEERSEALARTEASYYRLLWDYAAGNPGVALHFWRSCLARDEKRNVLVRFFDAPSAEALEGLPDEAVFVLRAVVQLGAATEANIIKSTSLRATAVADALRYGLACGYLEQDDGRYAVTWNWFRAITRLLRRRHLITTSV